MLNGHLKHSKSFCLLLSPDTDSFQFFCNVVSKKICVFFSLVYLKLLLEYITYVSIFVVIATAAPSNKKIFSDEFLNELRDEIVGKLQRDQFSDESMYYCLSLHSL